jgi:hypothetical protein
MLSEESIPVPVDRANRLALKLRPVPGALGARAKIERALSTRSAAVSFDRVEKAALLDALNSWMDSEGFETLGPDLIDCRGALEYELDVA